MPFYRIIVAALLTAIVFAGCAPVERGIVEAVNADDAQETKPAKEAPSAEEATAYPYPCRVDAKIMTPAIDPETSDIVARAIEERLRCWSARGLTVKRVQYVDDSEADFSGTFTLMAIDTDHGCIDLYPNGLMLMLEQHGAIGRPKTIAGLISYTVDHEIGHLLLSKCGNRLNNDILRAFRSNYRYRLGEYPGSKPEELFAESFAAYHADNRDRVHPQLIADIKNLEERMSGPNSAFNTQTPQVAATEQEEGEEETETGQVQLVAGTNVIRLNAGQTFSSGGVTITTHGAGVTVVINN